jgi:hypothetical protein
VDRLFLFYAPKIAGHDKVPFAAAETLPNLLPRETLLSQFGPDFAANLLIRDHFDS